MTTLSLLALLAILVFPLNRYMLSAKWQYRVPGAAILLWQVITGTITLCWLGIILIAPEEILALQTHLSGTRTPGILLMALMGGSFLVAGAMICRLAYYYGRYLVTALRTQSSQSTTVDIIGSRHPKFPQLRIVEVEYPLAYGIGGRKPRIVISRYLMNMLSTRELQAVIDHELAHIRQQHFLVLTFFHAYHDSIGTWLQPGASMQRIRLLLEILADQASLRQSPNHLMQALDKLYMRLGQPAGIGLRIWSRQRATKSAPRLGAKVVSLQVYAFSCMLLTAPTLWIVWPWLTQALARNPLLSLPLL